MLDIHSSEPTQPEVNILTITSIKQQVKNPERASIFVNGKYSFSLSLNELVSEKLKIGQKLNEPEFKRLKKLSDEGKLRGRALEWVLNRPRSEREFRQYLYQKKAEADHIEALLDEFREKKYMNEIRFAEWLIDLRQRAGKSERAIRAELSSKGVDRDIIVELMQGNDGEFERLKLLVAKKSKLSRYRADPQKFMQYLARQGFSYNDIKKALESKD